MSHDDRIFLTELDKHHPRKYRPQDLRSYIMLQSLFMPQSVTADAQFNNNPNLRALIFPKEGREMGLQQTPSDLFELIKEGLFVPAIRRGFSTLRDIRDEHLRHNVVHAPSDAYVDFVDGILDSQKLEFAIEDVSEAFKRRVIDAFSEANNIGPGGLARDKVAMIRDYAAEQPTLLFAEMNVWMKDKVADGRLNRRDVIIARNKVAECYRHNVPLSMGMNIDIPVTESEQFLPVDIRIGDRRDLKRAEAARRQLSHYDLPPMLFLSKRFLQKVPAVALVAIKGSRDGTISPNIYYQRVMKHLMKFRLAKNFQFDDFFQDLIYYLQHVEKVFMDAITLGDASLLRHAQNSNAARSKLTPWAREGGVNLISLVGGRLGALFGIVWSSYSAYSANADVTEGRNKVADALVEGHQLGLSRQGQERLVLSLSRGRTLLPSLR